MKWLTKIAPCSIATMSFRQMWRCESSIAVLALRSGRIALQGHDSPKHAQCGFEAKKKKKKAFSNLSSVTIVQLPTGRSAGKSRVATRKASLDSRPFLLRAPKTSRWLDPSPNCTTMHDVGGGYFCYRFLCYPASSTDYEALKSCEETEQLLGLLCYFCSLQPGLMGRSFSLRDL